MSREQTQFKPGHGGGPGRPAGFKGMAKKIMAATRDGDELLEFALRTLRDDAADAKDRQWAHQWLSDRGMGKPMQSIELHAEVAPALPAAMSERLASMTLEEKIQAQTAARAIRGLLEASTDGGD